MLPKEKQTELYDNDFRIRRLFTPQVVSVFSLKCIQEIIIKASDDVKLKDIIEKDMEKVLDEIDVQLKIPKKESIMKKYLTTAQAKHRYPLADWRTEVSNDDTKLGYDEWMLHKVESDGYTICEDPQRLYARQIATILFALRYVQRNYESSGYNLSDHLEPLTKKEIDQLCQDINLNKISL
jgi:hypothetical protein